MKTTKPIKKSEAIEIPQKPVSPYPHYYLPDVPHPLRARVLDLCIRRLYHDALELLHRHDFHDYTRDDLINFYHWGPANQPGRAVPEPEPPKIPRDYDQPSPEQIEDIRKRLAELPTDVAERVHHALQHDSIDAVASFLWKAGAGFTSAELYEFRKTLFPSNSLVDPYTSGPPVLRDSEVGDQKSEQPQPVNPEPPAAPPSSIEHPASINPSTNPVLNNPITQPSASPAPSPKPRPPKRSPKAAPKTDNPPPAIESGPILSDLRDLISRHVVLPDMAAETLALWVVHTYAFTLRQVTTYIGVVSPEKRCGKTTLLELLARLANRSLTAANISPSALFKVIQETSPTLLIDEADTFLQGRDELAGILNAGYRKDNAYVLRVADASGGGRASSRAAEFGDWTNTRADGSYTPVKFAQYSCWCPKVMAAIGRLPDTLADRCILITMQRKLPGEQCERLRSLNAVELRQRCAAFVRQHSDAIARAQPQIPAALNDRAADIWEPLFAIADLAGGDWPELARQAALKLSAADNDELTLIGYFLRDIRAMMLATKTDRILSRDIITTLNPRHDRPWEDLRRGREINEYWLAGKMRELGIRPKYFRHGNTSARGYMLADVEAAFRRYVPNPDAQPRSAQPPQSAADDPWSL